jgi:Nif-specific regulatory protein
MGKIFKYDIREIKKLSQEQFETLLKISELLNSSTYKESLIENVLDVIINVVEAERGLFAIYESESANFKIVSARNINKETITDLSEFSSGVLQEVVKKKKPVIYHDAQSDPDISQFESVQIKNIKSVIGMPIIRNKIIWGVILADSTTSRREFSESNILFFNFFSNLVSLALDRIFDLEVLRDEKELLINRLNLSRQQTELIGESVVMKELISLLRKVARTDATVLILGESGTGKDLTARAIHNLSDRRDKPFVAQFCGSIPENLLESELFGYKKGAFTGADSDKKGLIEAADQGTFFLDEISEISNSVQAKLLRVIENREITRLGDTEVRKVNVRLIAATNRDLKELVKQGKFREDLYYRLNVFPVKVPPLRERKEDIPLLVNYFLTKLGNENYEIDSDAIEFLKNYFWPGNVRQLLNVLQRAIILSDSHIIKKRDLIFEDEKDLWKFSGTLKDFEKHLLVSRLKEYKGNRSLTAESLGVSVRWIQLKVQEFGIEI